MTELEPKRQCDRGLSRRCQGVQTVEIRDLEYLAASTSVGSFAHAAKALGCNTST